VVTASEDKTARVWDLRGKRPSFVFLGGADPPPPCMIPSDPPCEAEVKRVESRWVSSAALSPDGTRVVTGHADPDPASGEVLPVDAERDRLRDRNR
jgi:WD40 repeat protein